MAVSPQVFPPALPTSLGGSLPFSLRLPQEWNLGGEVEKEAGLRLGKPPPSPRGRRLRPPFCPGNSEPEEGSQSQISPSPGSGPSWTTGAECQRVLGLSPGEPRGQWAVPTAES